MGHSSPAFNAKVISDFPKSDFVQDDRDIDQVLALNSAEYGPMSPKPSTDVLATRAEFIWRSDQNPAGRAIIPVIRDARGDVVGFFWLIPLKIRVQGQDYLGATGANLVIHEQHRRAFGYVKLQRRFNQALQDTDSALHLSFVSEENYRRLRLQSPERTFIVPSLIKPLDFGRLAQEHFTKKWQSWVANKAGYIVPPLFFKRPFLRRNGDISVHMIEQFDESFDAFWRRVQDKYPAMVIRDRAFLNWRFTPINGRRYHILVARAKGEMLGYAVIRCAKVRGLKTGLILDLLLLDDPREIEAGERLVAHAEAFFRSQEMSLLLALMAPGSAEYRILKRSGCRSLALMVNPRPFHFAFFVQDSHRKKLESLTVKDWFITLADFESL